MIPNGINLDKALEIARQHGCDVEPMRRTGEIRVSHPQMDKPCSRINARSRSSPRRLIVWLRHLIHPASTGGAQAGLSPIPLKGSDAQVEAITLPYRKPVWEVTEKDQGRLRLVPATMTAYRVAPLDGKVMAYPTSHAIAAQFDVPPEQVRMRLGDGSPLFLATEPGPMAVPEAALLGLFHGGIPCPAYYDCWSLYEQMAFDDRFSNGHLVRLGECEGVAEPEVEITHRRRLIRFLDTEETDCYYEDRGGRLFMDEGDYLRAEVKYRLRPTGRGIAWDTDEIRNLYLSIPYVKDVLRDFTRGHPLPDSWVRLNLAYALRVAWFLQQEWGRWWEDGRCDDIDLAIAWECSLFGENNHL